MGKKKKKKKKDRNKLSFMQEVGKVIHQKSAEIALALITGIVTNYLTDASEKLMDRYVHKRTGEPDK
ncbi:hypothetical protein [Adhaeribacter aerolatus]|nr:hypothetical protein [Adhaeribacter aerolatus]